MNLTITNVLTKERIRIYIFDVIALILVYCLPAISHLFMFPVYYLDPMKIILIFSILYTSRHNAYLIALTMPLVSFIFSSHPVLIKMFLITAELLLNAWLFYTFIKVIKNVFLSVFISILISKVFYYLIKFLFIRFTLLHTDLISTPLLYQVIVTLALSLYALITMNVFRGKLKRDF